MSKSANHQRIFAKEIPYVVGLFLLAAGWAITHATDRLLSSPIVEYSYSIQKGTKGQRFLKINLTNLSAELFTNVELEVQGSETTRVVSACDPPWVAIPPAWISSKQPETGNNSYAFTIDQLHPGWEATICVEFKGVKPPFLVLKQSNEKPIKLLHRSLETFLARNDICILLSLAGLWIAFAVCWFLGVFV